LINIGYLF